MQDQAEQLPAVDNRTAAPPRTGMVLAFDFGVKRIGTAVGSLELGLAHAVFGISAAAIYKVMPNKLVSVT